MVNRGVISIELNQNNREYRNMNWTKKDWKDLGLMVLGVAIGLLVTLLIPRLAPTTIIQYVFVLFAGLTVGYALRFGAGYFFKPESK